MSTHSPNIQPVVTAVIVAHDGAAWIPHVMRALLNQSHPVDRVVAVDTGSRDRSGAMLAEALGRGAVFGMDRGTGYAAAVHQALRHRAANAHVPQGAGGPADRVEWVWLLHDDCEPEPDALARLLAAAAQVPGVAVLGPKVMDWSDRNVLLEVGFTIDRAGRRITGIEPREMDQGQHDGDRDVVAVGSAGMLVRRDVWERVGGFDPGMRLFREDIDFCWRVLAAEYRVRVVTDAVVYHVEAASRNRRAAAAAPRRAREDRRNALLVLAGNLPAGQMLASLAGNLVLSLLRTTFFLLAKRVGSAVDEASACLSVTADPFRLMSARRRRARGRRAAFSRLRAEIPPGRSWRRVAEFAMLALSKNPQSEMVGSHHATEDPLDDDSLLVDTGIVQRLLTNPGFLLFSGLTAVTLVAVRSLLSGGPVGGGALVPAWGGTAGLWQEYLQGFHPVGIGSTASTPPYVAVIAALATLLGGKPWLAVDVILLGCVPLAGITAYLAARKVTAFAPARLWAAMSYALLPVGMGAVAAGRLGTAVVLVLLPVAGLLAGRVFTAYGRQARRAAWGLALLVAVAAAFVPLVWVIAVAAMAVALVAYGRGRPGSLLNAAIVTGVPLLLLLPWSASLFTHPTQFLLEAGLQPSGLASRGLSAPSLLLLSPGGPGLPPLWATAGLALAAVLALAAGGRRALVLAGWGAALIGLVAAAAESRVLVVPADGGTPVPAWPGAALALAGAGLALSTAAVGDSLGGLLREGRWRRVRGIAVVLIGVAAFSAPLLSAASWVYKGVNGPVAATTGQLLPEIASVSANSGFHPRTLVLRSSESGEVGYSVLRATDPLIGAPDLTSPPAAQHALDMAVAGLTAPDGKSAWDQGRTLANFGIGYVLMPAPVNVRLARLLDGVAGLRPVSKTSDFQLWQVIGTAARVRVVEPGGRVATVASGELTVRNAKVPSAGGTLVLAEPAGGWSASLNGHPLTPLAAPVDGWAQGFRLPPGGGTVAITRSGLARDLLVAMEFLAVLVVLGLALPGAKVAGEQEAEVAALAAARARGRPVGRGRRAMADGADSDQDPRRGGADGERVSRARSPVLAGHASGAAPAGMRGAVAGMGRRLGAGRAPSPQDRGAATGRRGPNADNARPDVGQDARPARGRSRPVPGHAAAYGPPAGRDRAGPGAAGRDVHGSADLRRPDGAVRGRPSMDARMGPDERPGQEDAPARGVLPRRADQRGMPLRRGDGAGRGVPPGRGDADSIPPAGGAGMRRPLPPERGGAGRGAPAGRSPRGGRDLYPGQPPVSSYGADATPGRGEPPGWGSGPQDPRRGESRPRPDDPVGGGRGRGGRPSPDRAGRGIPRGRLPGDDETLPPLPPLPPRSTRPRVPEPGYPGEDEEAPGWERGPRHDPPESGW